MRVTLDPIVVKDEYALILEREILAYFKEVIFDPINAVLEDNIRQNAEGHPVLFALTSGSIWYFDGQFFGSFDAAISRELRAYGATRTVSGFAIPLTSLPVTVRARISDSKQHSETTHNEIAAILLTMGALVGAASTGIQFAKTVDIVASDLQKQFVRSVSSVSGLPDPTDTPQELKEAIQQQIAQGTDLAIKNFTVEATAELRAKVLKNLQGGGRPDQLASIIEAEFGVARRKANFIAESEVSIAVSGFNQARAEELGSTSYVWETMGDSKVRPTHGESNNHRILNGRTFLWSDPPIVDAATGRRRHPGQDYGPCRCVARPVLNLTP